jgi:hypothetical protein
VKGEQADANDEDFVTTVTDYYLKSSDFNGLPLRLGSDIDPEQAAAVREELKQFIEAGQIVIRTAASGNPHIRAFAEDDLAKMIESLDTAELDHVVVYPSQDHLEAVLDDGRFANRPYTRELALGAGQLDFRAFDVAVLEWYRNDPRYSYTTGDWGGSISIKDEYFQNSTVPERVQVALKTFGFCFGDDMHRAVAVYCVYLGLLTPEHQQVWKARELAGQYKLHPDYYRTSIMGDWPERLSLFDAYMRELKVVNQMSEAMGRPPLFRKDFDGNRPANFGFLVRPTEDEYNGFVLTLDKMLSDNINKKFFGNDVAGETEEPRKDSKIIVRQRGTIAMLDEWIRSRFRPEDPAPIDEMFKTIKDVRKARQKPAHGLKPNVFDPALVQRQRDLMSRTYAAIRTLRLILTNHPAVDESSVDMSKELREGKIWRM